MLGIVQHIHHVRSSDARGIVDAGVLVRGVFLQLCNALTAEREHVLLAAEMQTPRSTGFYTGRLESGAYAVRTQRAFVNLLRLGVELRDIERAPRYAVLAADTVVLLEVDDPIRVLNDRAVGRTSPQTSRIGAV